MYLRRLRTVMDLVLAPDAKNSWLNQYARELLNQVSADARQDSTLWTGAHVAPTDKPIARFDPAQLLARIEERRRELYNTAPGGYGSLIPSAQIDPQIAFGAGVEAGQVAQSALILVNCSMTAVDISNWTLTGGKGRTYQFKPGVVIPGNGGRLYVTPDVRAFRTNQLQQRSADLLGLFVQGGFPAELLGTIQGGRLVRPPYALRDGIHLVATSVGPGRPCP